MKKITKYRIVVILIFVVVDLFLVPSILDFPRYLKEYGIRAMTEFVHGFNPLKTFYKVLSDDKFRKMFLMAQPLFVALCIYSIWKNPFQRQDENIQGIGGPKASGAGQFGTARWLSPKEVTQETTPWVSDTPMKPGGIVLGMESLPGGKGHKVYLETNDTHSLEIGTSRSGKSRTFIIPTIYALSNSGESMVLNDPKGELFRKTSRYLESKGYKIVLLDFRNPSRGNRWNPMKLIVDALENGDESLASEAALDMAHTVVHQQKRSGDPIWANGEESVIAALSLAIAQEAEYEGQKHLTSVYNTLIELGQPVQTPDGEYIALNEFFKNLPTGDVAKQAFGPASLAPDRTRGSFYSGAATSLRLFGDPGIANLTSTQDHDLAGVGKEKTAVFMIVPDEKTTRHVLASLYVDQCYQALVTLASKHNDRLPNRVNFLLDEFGNMPPINGMDAKITVAAGRGIRFHLVIQALGQLKEKYGDASDIIKGNTHTWIYLLSTDIKTCEEISKKTGTYTVENQNYSTSVQSKNLSHGMSSSLTSRALLTPDEVSRWQYGQALVFLQRKNPARLPLPDYTQWGFSKELIELDESEMERNPLIKVPIYIPYLVSVQPQGIQESSKEEMKEQKEQPKKSIVSSLDNNMETAIREVSTGVEVFKNIEDNNPSTDEDSSGKEGMDETETLEEVEMTIESIETELLDEGVLKENLDEDPFGDVETVDESKSPTKSKPFSLKEIN